MRHWNILKEKFVFFNLLDYLDAQPKCAHSSFWPLFDNLQLSSASFSFSNSKLASSSSSVHLHLSHFSPWKKHMYTIEFY